jgi:hypothetical protein
VAIENKPDHGLKLPMKISINKWHYILVGCCLASNPHLARAQDRPDPDRVQPDNDPKRAEADKKDDGRGDQVKHEDGDRAQSEEEKAKAKRAQEDEQRRKADEKAAKEREERGENKDSPPR